MVAISFEPSSEPGTVNGEITWGGTDSSKFTGSINFAYAFLFLYVVALEFKFI